MRGVGYLPAVAIDAPDSQLIFRPTAVQGSATQAFAIRNTSRVPVSFEVGPRNFKDMFEFLTFHAIHFSFGT